MNVQKLIEDLKLYKSQLDEAIGVLERLAAGRGTAPTRKMSAATKKKMADAQKRRWAEYRKQTKS